MSKLAQRQNRKKTKGVWITVGVILAVFFLLIVGILTAVALNGGFGMNEDQKAMRNYLTEKYGDEFSVNKPERKGSGLGVEGYLQAEARAKGSDIVFSVQSSSDGFYDTYQASTWINEELPNITTLVNSSLKDYPVQINLSIHPSQELWKTLGGNIVTYEQANSTYGKEITYLLELGVESDENGYAALVSYLKDNLGNVVEHIDVQNVAWTINLQIPIKDTSYKYVCNLGDENQQLGTSLETLNSCFKKYTKG